LGVSGGWVAFIGLAGSMLGSSGVFFLMKYVSIDMIFIGSGALGIIIAFFLSFGLKEIYHAKSADPKQGFKTTLD
jgi:hypothetical protein